ncbi:DUF1178 family protein [Inquilinus sp. Marseille-Q2685]|uniref:DUF1178 family protein n=1 Tax=Inquilinus sp. Marseille-Q2685 TaxID=2866581 RepID=UPI001CE469F0|nr:DUF1178 family protein [Inquilinus sp. Marseille-Q2685]
MILYELRCEAGHGFEAWFRNSGTYDTQVAAGEVNCPVCGSSSVEKALMAPAIAKRPPKDVQAEDGRRTHTTMAEARRQLEALRRKIEESCEYVGDRFADEARKIHYEESEHRDIYGEATEAEARELEEEGIGVARIPWVSRTDS